MYLGFPLDLEPVARIGVCLSRPRVVLAWSVVVAVRLTLLLTCTYGHVTKSMVWDLENAQSHSAHFKEMFTLTHKKHVDMKGCQEFAAFYNILQSYHVNSAHTKDNPSSSLKASTFTVNFILP